MASTALLVMDVQQGIVERFATGEGYLTRLAAAIETARGAGIAVIRITEWTASLSQARSGADGP
jgi:nicotinamidase-related amidase